VARCIQSTQNQSEEPRPSAGLLSFQGSLPRWELERATAWRRGRRCIATQRVLAGAASLAGLGWVAKDLGSRLSSDPDYWDCNSSYDYALNAIDTIAFVLLVPVLVGLFRAYRTSTQARVGVAALGSAAGFGVAGIANLLEHCAGMDALGFAYVIGAMVGFLLLLVFAVALTPVAPHPNLGQWAAGRGNCRRTAVGQSRWVHRFWPSVGSPRLCAVPSPSIRRDRMSGRS
jgi:hypothetical protein